MKVRVLAPALFFIPAAVFGAGDVTFYRDVLPVLQKNCQECHRPGEAAPMSFLTYKDTRPWAAAIRQATATREMPPWHADPAHGHFSNDRRLSDHDMQTLETWAKTGAKEGNLKDSPAPREFAQGWTIGKPDVVLDMGTDFHVPAKGTVEYTYFVVPTHFAEDKWIEKIEVRPSARSVVHHAVLFARGTKAEFMRPAKPGEPFVPSKRDDERGKEGKKPVDTGEGAFFALAGAGTERGIEMISTYVPGGTPYLTLPGQARLLKAGSDLVFQMHYTTNGKEAVDRSQVGIIFAKEPPKERVVNTFVINDRFHIPPGDPNFLVNARVTVQSDVKLQSMFPHMHLRGKAMQYRAVYPTGESEILLDVPKYDFNWQMTYFLEQPKILPKGTRLEIAARYDNSPNNPYNPNPKADVYWGDQSWEEMLAAFVDFAIPVSMNPADIVKAPKTPQQQAAAAPKAE